MLGCWVDCPHGWWQDGSTREEDDNDSSATVLVGSLKDGIEKLGLRLEQLVGMMTKEQVSLHKSKVFEVSLNCQENVDPTIWMVVMWDMCFQLHEPFQHAFQNFPFFIFSLGSLIHEFHLVFSVTVSISVIDHSYLKPSSFLQFI